MLKNKQNIATLIFAKRWFGRFNNLPVTTLVEKWCSTLMSFKNLTPD